MCLSAPTFLTYSQLVRTRQWSIVSSSLDSISIKDLGTVNKILGMRVEMDSDRSYNIDEENALNEII